MKQKEGFGSVSFRLAEFALDLLVYVVERGQLAISSL